MNPSFQLQLLTFVDLLKKRREHQSNPDASEQKHFVIRQRKMERRGAKKPEYSILGSVKNKYNLQTHEMGWSSMRYVKKEVS